MPFKSQAQMRAAFGGFLGPKMKAKAKTWAKHTPNIGSLPSHVGGGGKKKRARAAGMAYKTKNPRRRFR